MTALPCIYDDGGRLAAGFKGHTGDCTVRAFATASGLDYKTVYDALNARGAKCKITKIHKTPCRARTGVCRKVMRQYMADLGWIWTPTMGIGTGTQVHMAEGELPMGRLVVALSGHTSAVIDGVVHDTYDPTREGSRAVYGYWRPKRSSVVAGS